MSQEEVFVRQEADKWFERNASVLRNFNPEKDYALKLIDLYGLRPRRVIEIGGSSGFRLAEIEKRYAPERLVCVEPSEQAIAYGKTQYPSIAFVKSLAYEIPLQELFDLVIVNGVFCWVGREHLLRSVAEADRLLADGGCLAFGDFLPPNPSKVPYHHLPEAGMFTFKQDYARIFLSTNIYRMLGCLTSEFGTKVPRPGVADMNQLGHFLLQKDLTGGYVPRDIAPPA